jgi:hypothetical protein
LLDLKSNQLVNREFEVLANILPAHLLELFATRDEQRPHDALNKDQENAYFGVLTFEKLFRETEFVPSMRELCRTLQRAYNYPVDIEFTANFAPDGKFRVNLLQCRPFQVKIGGEGSRAKLPERIEPENLVCQSAGPIVGHSLAANIDRLIFVVPSVYSHMSMSHRYSVARTIGRLTHLDPPGDRKLIMLLGPGRWGTSMPSLGVPVSFAEINTVSVICELGLMHDGLVPDVSLGTHFFNDLVEMDMLYLAVSPGRKGHVWNEALLRDQPNLLTSLLPSAAGLSDALRVIDARNLSGGGNLCLNVDSMKQRGLLYRAT